METEKYTEKSLEALRLAQSLSKQKHSPQIEQEHLLRREGVEIKPNGCVDMKKFQWDC